MSTNTPDSDKRAPKYAPANEAGLKPYVLVILDWGKKIERVVYAENVGDARASMGRKMTGINLLQVRRALPSDVGA